MAVPEGRGRPVLCALPMNLALVDAERLEIYRAAEEQTALEPGREYVACEEGDVMSVISKF